MYFTPIRLEEVIIAFVPIFALTIGLVFVIARSIVRPYLQAKYGAHAEGATLTRIRGLEARVAMLERQLGGTDFASPELLEAGSAIKAGLSQPGTPKA